MKMSYEPYPINDLSEFKAWKLQFRNAAKLLDVIIFRWRVASARIRGKSGKWAAYLAEKWCRWSGLSIDQFKRALRILEQDQLIIRERHRFGGLRVHAFLQPTMLALTYQGKEGDFARIEKSCPPTPNGADAPSNAPTGALTDHTTSSIKSTLLKDSQVCDPLSGLAPEILELGKIPGEKEEKGEITQSSPATSEVDGMPKSLVETPLAIWELVHTEKYPDTYAALTAIHRKQLNDFVAKCPAEYGGNVLKHAILNWGSFCARAKTEAAAFKLPPKPTVSFLLKFLAPAVGQWMDDNSLEYTNGKVQAKLCARPKLTGTSKPDAIVEILPISEDDKPATLEEVMAIFNGTDAQL